ncbi:MAG: lipopolysaccharide biosynthesis protein [Bacteroidetes bacterium]|nr:lipopolysaccharide biosynthesis protein [Bacteroidota bacterium]
MGIVVRQSLITTIISYAGVVIGYINLVFLYPKYLETNQVGLLRAILDSAMVLTPFASLGVPQAVARFYPRFHSDENRLSSFITLTLLISMVGFLVMTLLLKFFQDPISNFFAEEAPELLNYPGLILWLTLTLTISGIFEQMARSKMMIALPALLKDVVIRAFQAVLVLFYLQGTIDFDQFLFGSVGIYTLTLITLLYYLGILRRNTFQLQLPEKSEIKEIIVFGLITFIGLSSVIVVAKVDSLMVTGFLGLEAAAIYTTTYYMASVIEVPKRALTQSASALLAHAFEKGDLKSASSIYRKTALHQMLIGGLLLTGIWANLENIFDIMPKGDIYEAGAWVVMVIGCAKLMDMSFGPSSEVIGLSKHYWFNLVVIALLATFTVAANILLIPVYGMNGAAIGTLAALFLYNLAKAIFISVRIKMHPFDGRTTRVAIVIMVTVFINQLIPKVGSSLSDAIVRSTLLTAVYCFAAIGLNCSDEANQLFYDGLKRLGLDFRRRK